MSDQDGLVRAWQRLYEASEHLNQRLVRQLQSQDESRRDSWDTLRRALGIVLMHRDRLKRKKAARLLELQRQLVLLAPAYLNMILKREVFPLDTADSGLIELLCENLTDSDVIMFASILKNKASGEALVAIFLDRRDRYKRKQAEEDRIVNEASGRNPEADAAGRAH